MRDPSGTLVAGGLSSGEDVSDLPSHYQAIRLSLATDFYGTVVSWTGSDLTTESPPSLLYQLTMNGLKHGSFQDGNSNDETEQSVNDVPLNSIGNTEVFKTLKCENCGHVVYPPATREIEERKLTDFPSNQKLKKATKTVTFLRQVAVYVLSSYIALFNKPRDQ